MRRAFTLIELLVVAAIIALLAGLILGASIALPQRAKVAVTSQRMQAVLEGLQRYVGEVGSLADLRRHALGDELEFRTVGEAIADLEDTDVWGPLPGDWHQNWAKPQHAPPNVWNPGKVDKTHPISLRTILALYDRQTRTAEFHHLSLEASPPAVLREAKERPPMRWYRLAWPARWFRGDPASADPAERGWDQEKPPSVRAGHRLGADFGPTPRSWVRLGSPWGRPALRAWPADLIRDAENREVVRLRDPWKHGWLVYDPWGRASYPASTFPPGTPSPSEPCTLAELSPLHSLPLLQAAGMLAGGTEGRALYRRARGVDQPWNDRWGGPLVVVCASYIPPRADAGAGDDGNDRMPKPDDYNSWSGRGAFCAVYAPRRDLLLRRAMEVYGFDSALYVAVGAPGAARAWATKNEDPPLKTWLGATPLTWSVDEDTDASDPVPLTDRKVLRGLWRQVREVTRAHEWTEQGFRTPPWRGHRLERATVEGVKLSCMVSAPIEIHD